jgi:hypothetical protein
LLKTGEPPLAVGSRGSRERDVSPRETIERTIKDLPRTGATTFEELFAAVVKVIED